MSRKLGESEKFRRNFTDLQCGTFAVHDFLVGADRRHDAIAFLKRIIVLVFGFLQNSPGQKQTKENENLENPSTIAEYCEMQYGRWWFKWQRITKQLAAPEK